MAKGHGELPLSRRFAILLVLPSAALEAGPAVEQYLLPVEAVPELTLEATSQSPSELSHCGAQKAEGHKVDGVLLVRHSNVQIWT